jgi:carboxylesterase 2
MVIMRFSSQRGSVAWLLLPTVRAALYNTVLQTNSGPVVGYNAFNSSPAGIGLDNWENVAVWKGIPFAANTSGNNRFRSPQSLSAWNETLYAADYGPVCPLAATGNFTIDEDCLNLNIWSAANSSDDKLPVVMWSYPSGSTASDALFNGGGMAAKNIVFVSYNYRTGPFGWLASSELSEERLEAVGVNSSGNYAILDQFAALHWIRGNIEAFGGDPEHITVQGQSEGSATTYHILNSPLTKGEIVGAIIESGVRDPHDPLSATLAEKYISQDVALANGESYQASLNCSDIACMRSLPMEDLMSGTFKSLATLDYYALPSKYITSLLDGAANQVPVITGNAKDENGATWNLTLSLAEYLADMNETFSGVWLDRFLEQYPANSSESAPRAYDAQWTDRSNVGTWLWTRLWANGSEESVYNYFWDHAPPGVDQGAYHESEINYVLNNLYDTDLPWQWEDYVIAAKMNAYWVNFIKTGDPNGGNLTAWPAAGGEPLVQHVGDGWGQIPVADKAKIKLFEDWFATLEAY